MGIVTRACFPKQKYNNPAVVDDSPPAAINTALAVGLLSPAETTTHSPLQWSVPSASRRQTKLCPPTSSGSTTLLRAFHLPFVFNITPFPRLH